MSEQKITVETPVVNDPGRTVALDYGQVRQSWLDAPTARDQDGDGEAVRLYAVSAALQGPWVHVRYLHPRGTVKRAHMSVGRNDDGSFYPKALERSSRADWLRSIVPLADDGPDDVFRAPEMDWLDDLWSDRAELREVATV